MNLPDGYINRIRQQLKDDFPAFIKSMEEAPCKAFRINRKKTDPADFDALTRMVTGSDNADPVPDVLGAYYYTDASPGRSALHEAGAFYIQEPSAMLPVTLLDAEREHLKVLDLCAAPGGKTTQIADCMGNGGLLVANEIIPSRAAILSENIERMGIENALVINEDPQNLADRFSCFFDRILVDAPCSGEGMFRKNPEAITEWSTDNVLKCAARQDMILDCAAKMLCDNGRIVYSTCTFSPEEDEGTVKRFLDRHPDFSVCDGPHRIWPHLWKGEGHFAVAFMRKSGPDTMSRCKDKPLPADTGIYVKVRRKNISSVKDARNSDIPSRSQTELLSGFMENTLKDTCRIRHAVNDNPHRLVMFGDSIYLTPEYMPDITGLKVLRAGLKLGSFKKNRFEPDHALSHALTPDDVKQSLGFAADDMETAQYLAGMTMACDKDMNGWCLVCANGFPIGWGKAVGGTVKNHYPKGLRKTL